MSKSHFLLKVSVSQVAPLSLSSPQSLPRKMSFHTQYSLCFTQLHLFLFLLQQLSQLGVALRHKVQDQFTAIILKHPCGSSRETQGLQGRREKHRLGDTQLSKIHRGNRLYLFHEQSYTNLNKAMLHYKVLSVRFPLFRITILCLGLSLTGLSCSRWDTFLPGAIC